MNLGRITAAGIAVAALVSAPAGATDVSVCAKIHNDLDRLACYDEGSGRTPVSVTSIAPEGDWATRISTSKLTDATDVFLTLNSEKRVYCKWDKEGSYVRLTLRCMENTTALLMVTECHMASGHGGYGTVDYRTDKDKAGKWRMDASTDNKALGLWNGGQSIPAIKRLFERNSLILRFTPYGDSSQTATFNISGLEASIGPLRENCHW